MGSTPLLSRQPVLSAANAQGLSMRHLATLAHVSQSHLSEMLSARRGVTLHVLVQVARVLGVDPMSLVEWRTPPEKPNKYSEYF